VVEVCPFRGVRYNQSLVKDLAAVICPPYDIISPQFQQELGRRSQYNFVRLEHGQESAQDTPENNKYTRSAALLEQWLERGVLKADETPALYIHKHSFTCLGQSYHRRGIICRVRLEEWDKMVIRPHEGLLGKPKDDRLRLLWALQANTSPVMALFEDRRQAISSLLDGEQQAEPIIDVSAVDGEGHKIWAVTAPDVIKQVCASLSDQPLYIADGHHRYESALNHKRERVSCSPSILPDDPLNFVMMTLVDFADPGLVILPPHRLVSGISATSLKNLAAKLKLFFDIDELSLAAPDVWLRFDDMLAVEQPGQVRLGLVGLADGKVMVLKLRSLAAVDQMMPYFHSELYRKLGVSILDHVILENLLGVREVGEDANIAYSYDRREAVRKVSAKECQLAFILNSVKAEVIRAIADAGDRMPRKSTYFYPKAPAGLILHRLV